MKLKKLLASHGINQTQLARLLGRDKSAITNLLQGRRLLKADEAGVIAQALGVPVGQILGLDDALSAGVEERCLIPFQHAPQKTRQARQVVQKGGTYYLEETGTFSPKAYALEVRDDGLNLSGILPGDIVISELDHPAKPGQFVLAQHYAGGGAETLVRRFDPPYLAVHSSNPVHRTLSLDHDDVRVVSPVLKLVRLL